MNNERIPGFPYLDDTFFRVFTAWFHCDLLPNDDAEIVKLAGICASDLHNQKRNLEGIASDLQRLLANWQPKDAWPFSDASNTDWLADDEMEQLLLKTLEKLTKDLYYFAEQDQKSLATQL
jgi:hypothetical protein